MELPPDSRKIFFILNNLAGKKTPASEGAIRAHPLWSQQGSRESRFRNALDHLLESRYVVSTSRGYSLTDPGLALLKQFMSAGFSSLLLAAEQSPTSRRFCQQVYGLDLCQFNSMSMAQFNQLLAVLNLGPGDHILDLAAGSGEFQNTFPMSPGPL